MTEKRPPAIGLALAAVAALIFVGGTLWSVLSAEDAEIEDEQPRPTLSEVMEDSRLVVRGVADSVMRLGDPSDAGVKAVIRVDEVVAAASEDEEPSEVVVFDKDFRESWGAGQDMLLFLGTEGALPEDAEYRVLERCIFDEETLPCPYDTGDIEVLEE